MEEEEKIQIVMDSHRQLPFITDAVADRRPLEMQIHACFQKILGILEYLSIYLSIYISIYIYISSYLAIYCVFLICCNFIH